MIHHCGSLMDDGSGECSARMLARGICECCGLSAGLEGIQTSVCQLIKTNSLCS